ncbi:hypothetical protein E1301_Tti003027 [Triplophysa tibetana]|uniref:Saposin B-type domain-containing protein n=1 Tax=Triplophysa tibetana TaxID=1572043 RepID=A0A5A9NP76_9TELE|nr:hypothetical protein E1301_Tti003027 [Triplophysa tibetana]
MMLSNIVLITLLVSSVLALPLEMYEDNSIDNEMDDNFGTIKKMLREVCDGIGFLQFVCKNLVANYMGTLLEELSTTDDAPTICRHVGIC